MSYLVQTSPFLGQVFHPNGEVEVIDTLVGHFELFNKSKCSFGHLEVELIEPYLKQFTLRNDVKIIIQEVKCNKGKLGSQCWMSSIAFAIWCQHTEHLNNTAPKSILELGSGVGLAGISLASLPSSLNYSISMTEYIDTLTDVISKNISSNNTLLSSIPKVSTLDWDKHIDNNSKYDYVIACDCVYKEDSSSLVKTIVNSLSDNPNSRALIFNTSPKHRLWVNEFIVELKQNGTVLEESFTLVHNHNHTHTAEFILLTFKKH